MILRIVPFAVMCCVLVAAGCSQTSNELPIPAASISNGGTSAASAQFGYLGAVPDGVQVGFVADVELVRGEHFANNTRAFFGMNNQLARRPDSLLTTPRHILPGDPFVYEDPVTGQKTILEVEAKVEFTNWGEIRIMIPPSVACSAAFTNPIVRLYGDGGSSFPVTDVYFIVGPRCAALTPKKGIDTGGFDVTVHGDFFSPYTQVAFRYVDPTDGLTKVIGDTPETDITEHFIDRHTLVIPEWPGIVPDSTHGLATELAVDVLIFENVDEITGDPSLEPFLGGNSPCSPLFPESPDAPLSKNGVRNTEKVGAFTFLPTGVTDYPSIAGIVPESGPEIGGNTVIIHGDQFDAFTADISNPSDPGIGIECPPDSGNYIAPLSAVLVDRQTLAIVMPPCAVDIPQAVNFCLKNKYSIDNPGGPAAAGPGGTCVVFEDIYTYTPIPPILPPVVTAIHAASGPYEGEPVGSDYGLQRLLVVGDWFDADTTLNGGFEFLLPDGQIIQSLRTILHNRNLIEVITKRLPEGYYPLSEDLVVDVRVRNVVGHADFEDVFTFRGTPDAEGSPTLSELCPDRGPFAGGNEVLVFGSNFDTTTTVLFGGTPATDVQFIHSGLLVVTAPAAAEPGGSDLEVEVVADDEGDQSEPLTYTYSEEAEGDCPVLGALDPNSGSATGGYDILAYGANLTPLTRIEFGVDLDEDFHSGNFSPRVFFLSSKALLVEVPEALPEQIGATIGVAATDPLGGCPDPIKTAEFTYLPGPDCVPEILYVDTSVEVPAAATIYPALTVGGGDRMLVIGRCFDQRTTFDIEKPQESGTSLDTQGVQVLTPNIAIMTSPQSPDGLPGLADLQAHNPNGDSNEFTVEYVAPAPPSILDVRNLDDSTQTAPIDGNDRLIIFGDSFFAPVEVKLTGCDLNNQPNPITISLTSPNVTLVEDHLIGVNVPPDTFCEGPLAIEVITPYGTATFEDEGGPIFQLIGPQPPIVTGVFPTKFNSAGGEEAVFFGRYFTETTEFSVRTSGDYKLVFSTLIVSENTAIVTMPDLPGGIPPTGIPGDVRAEEKDPVLVSKIAGDPFTESEELFSVCNDHAPLLLAVYPDHGFIEGGEQVLLLGSNFLTATGDPNLTDIRFEDFGTGIEVGDYTPAAPEDLPLTSADKGKYVILNDHSIHLITHAHDKVEPEHMGAPMDVVLKSLTEDSMLSGGYTYINSSVVRTPLLLGITPNQTRLLGGTSHLLSGGFLTEADRIVLHKDETTFTIPTDAGSFSEVNDSFLVFVMPDLTGTFDEGDVLDVWAEKDFDGDVLKSNTLYLALTIVKEPPIIEPEIADPEVGSAFGGTIVTLTGGSFTPNSQVLFGTLPARNVVVVGPDELIAVAPRLPVDVPDPGLDLKNITTENGKVDVAVFTQGGWATLEEGYQFLPEKPVVSGCDVSDVPEGATVRINVTGEFFVPTDTTATVPAGHGTITNLVVHDFEHLSFDYEAPSFAPGETGPFAVEITIATGQGGPADDPCELSVHIDPELDDCETTYSVNDHAAPTTGVESGALVEATLTGRNFLAGGALRIKTRENKAGIELTEVETFTAGGQFMVDDSETITFTVPNIFSANVPNLIDGNPNVGPAEITYESPYGPEVTLADCFHYVPHLTDFEASSYTLPTVSTEFEDDEPTSVAVGDINADGVNDAVTPGTEGSTDAWVLIANTFGTVDVNGDGKTPDWDGTFTVTRILHNELDFDHDIDEWQRSKSIRLANLDGDDELEILIPGHVSSAYGPNRARVLIIDVDSGGFGTETLYEPGTTTSAELRSLAVGDFDGDSRDDFAFITGQSEAFQADRRLGLVTSPGGAFVFSEVLTPLSADMSAHRPGELVAGDWDGDGDSDLMYAAMARLAAPALGDTTLYNVIVVEVASGNPPSVVGQSKLTNFNGGRLEEIEVIDVDRDGKEDAVLIVDDTAHSDVFPEASKGSGFAVALDPLGSLTVNSYTQTMLEGRLGATGDFNGDGIPDLAMARGEGEWILYFGNGVDGFVDSGRSWQLNSQFSYNRDELTYGIAAGDMNGDGLAELFMGDYGRSPRNMVLWLNTSR